MKKSIWVIVLLFCHQYLIAQNVIYFELQNKKAPFEQLKFVFPDEDSHDKIIKIDYKYFENSQKRNVNLFLRYYTYEDDNKNKILSLEFPNGMVLNCRFVEDGLHLSGMGYKERFFKVSGMRWLNGRGQELQIDNDDKNEYIERLKKNLFH